MGFHLKKNKTKQNKTKNTASGWAQGDGMWSAEGPLIDNKIMKLPNIYTMVGIIMKLYIKTSLLKN